MRIPSFVVFAGLALAIAALTGCGPKSPAEVTDSQIALYQDNVVKGCTKAGKEQGKPDAEVSRLCGCIIDLFKREVAKEQWQQAYFLATRHDDEGEKKVFETAMTKLAVCRAPGQ